MCIAVFVWQAHPVYPFLLLLNRDEYHDRPTKGLEWWEGDAIVGGRDVVAGGTWLACSRQGRVSFLTNVRELQKLPLAKSRGHLPLRFLQSKKTPMEFAEEMKGEADEYNGFNLIVADMRSMGMVYVTNRPSISIAEVSPGIHVLSNASLDSPWPKAQRLERNMKEVLEMLGEDEVVCLHGMAEKLMRDTTKDEDKSQLSQIYPPDFEYQLSSIFVEAETALGRYGTRSTSGVYVKGSSGEVSFYQNTLLREQEEESWKQQALSFHIQDYSSNSSA